MPKNMASKGASRKNMVCKEGGGGATKKMPLSLVVTASVIMQTSARMPKNSVSKILKIQIKQMQD